MKNKKLKVVLSVLAIIFVFIGTGFYIYVNDYYHAEPKAFEAMKSSERVSIKQVNKKVTVFEPEAVKAGFIFYPGGKVECEAYAPLLHSLAEKGILGILVKMPMNLAVFDMNAADGLQTLYPNVKTWYIGGHSLGGAMAASYIGKHTEEYEGLILLAAYSTADLNKTNLKVISIYGSEDSVLSKEKYEKNKGKLPEGFVEMVIDGGCHAYFGSYGMQKGDGTPTISNEKQIEITTDEILSIVNKE